MDLLEHCGTLVVVRCWCGVQHAVPESLRSEQRRQFENKQTQLGIYCPLGHTHAFAGKSRAETLEADLQRERQKHDQTKAALDHQRANTRATERRLIATKGIVTRVKNRVANGVCPCCKRHFENLARHMKTKHADYGTHADAELQPK